MIKEYASKPIAKNFKITKQLGKGGFGVIFKAFSIKNEKEFAVKAEPIGKQKGQLFNEFEIYKWLHSSPDIKFQPIPQVYYYGIEGAHNIMILDLLGPSLKDLMEICGGSFSIKTVLMIADQLLQRIEFLHSMRIIHRDIKPPNMAIGIGRNSHRLFLIDFGLARKYITSSGKHLAYREGKSMVGTAKYSSLATSEGIEQSRRDDIESLFNVLVYIAKGMLPWANKSYKTKKELYKAILISKRDTPPEKLCNGLPEEFVMFINYVRNLGYEDTPCYEYLRSLLRNLFFDLKFILDYQFDWVGKVKTG